MWNIHRLVTAIKLIRHWWPETHDHNINTDMDKQHEKRENRRCCVSDWLTSWRSSIVVSPTQITHSLVARSVGDSATPDIMSTTRYVHRQLCLSHNHCDLQPWARAVCTFPAVPRSTQPSTLRGTVNEYQLSCWVIIINGDGGCRR